MLDGSLYRWLLTVAAAAEGAVDVDENIRWCSSLFLAYTVEVFFDVVVVVVAETKLDAVVDEEVDADSTTNNTDVTPRLAMKQWTKQKGDEEGDENGIGSLQLFLFVIQDWTWEASGSSLTAKKSTNKADKKNWKKSTSSVNNLGSHQNIKRTATYGTSTSTSHTAWARRATATTRGSIK